MRDLSTLRTIPMSRDILTIALALMILGLISLLASAQHDQSAGNADTKDTLTTVDAHSFGISQSAQTSTQKTARSTSLQQTLGEKMVELAISVEGAPYNDKKGEYPNYKLKESEAVKNEGIDCSGLVFWAFNKAAGASTERPSLDPGNDVCSECIVDRYGAHDQWKDKKMWEFQKEFTVAPTENELKPGDLLYVNTEEKGAAIDHVGIYAGNGRVIHSTVGGVKELSYDEWKQNYKSSFFGYGRVSGADNLVTTIDPQNAQDLPSLTQKTAKSTSKANTKEVPLDAADELFVGVSQGLESIAQAVPQSPDQAIDNKFQIGDKVEITDSLNVRSTPGLPKDYFQDTRISDPKSKGSTGTILNGPVSEDGFTWWEIEYDDGTTGWSQDKRLERETANHLIADQSPAFGAIPVGTSQMEHDKSNTKETLLIPTLHPITSPPPDESNSKERITDQMEIKIFDRGNKVETTNSLNVRDAPGISSSTVIGTKVAGSAGTILEGPIYSDGFTWWKIQYDDGTTGWSQDKRLERETANHLIADQSSAFGAIPVGTSQGLPPYDQPTGSAEAWNEEANSLCGIGKYDEAIKCLDKAIELDPTNLQFWNNKSVIFCNQGNYEDAMQCLDKIIFIDPRFSAALNSKGEILMKMGRYSEAIKYINRAIEIDPEYEPALINKEAAQKALGIDKKINEEKQLAPAVNDRAMIEDIEAYIDANFDNIASSMR